MNLSTRWHAFIICSVFAGCGGGSGSDDGKSGAAGGSATATSYAFVPPPLNSQRVYSQSIVDDYNNTINNSYTETVTALNSDGTFDVFKEDPSDNTVVSHGTTYGTPPETLTNNASGQTLSYLTGGGQVTCTLSPHGAGPTYPVTIGASWSIDYTTSCDVAGSSTISYQQTGQVADLESVTLPAGTFSALKLQTTLVWTDPQGMTHTMSGTNWRDAATGVSVKQVNTYSYSGTLSANSYPISETIVLQSGAP